MAETLTVGTMLELLPKLYTAFPRTLGKDQLRETAQVYRDGLRGLSGDGVRAAVDRVIREDNYFPKVARLRELAREWERSNVVIVAPQAADPLWCPNCQSKAVPREQWRPRVDERHRVLLDADAKFLLLEPVPCGGRYLCKCAPPPNYAAHPGTEPPAMLIESLQGFYARRCLEGIRTAFTVVHHDAPLLTTEIE